jgi:glycosyltransferase involved in cell wall biosynthesis
MISVTVPICNEIGNIEPLCDRICTTMEQVGRPWELVLVNDGSTDGSEEKLNEMAARNPAVKVIHFRRNFGQTAAMMAGFDHARGEIIIPMDGDLQNDPADIPLMLSKLEEGYDVCSGWRKDRQDDAIRRNIPSIMANRLISFVSGVRLHDFGCSLKAYRREVIEGVRIYGEMHRFLPIYVSWHGARIAEVPVRHYARTSGKSKYGLERVLKVLADLIVVKFLDRFQQKPMYIFGGVGLFSLIVSFISGVFALYLKFVAVPAKSFIETPVPLLCAMAAMTGLMCILMGLLAEMIMRTFYESQGKAVYLVRETRNMEPPLKNAHVRHSRLHRSWGPGDLAADDSGGGAPWARRGWLWQDESAGVFLGHRRLSIVDLAGGAQPMWTRDGQLGVTFNGEIYNHGELRTELKARGCEFATDHSDTEVLLHGYREWGEEFVQRLNGMWALSFTIARRSGSSAAATDLGKSRSTTFMKGKRLALPRSCRRCLDIRMRRGSSPRSR